MPATKTRRPSAIYGVFYGRGWTAEVRIADATLTGARNGNHGLRTNVCIQVRKALVAANPDWPEQFVDWNQLTLTRKRDAA